MNKKDNNKKQKNRSIAALYMVLRSNTSNSKTKLSIYEIEYLKWDNLHNLGK